MDAFQASTARGGRNSIDRTGSSDGGKARRSTPIYPLFGVLAVLVSLGTYAAVRYEEFNRQLTSYMGVPLGASMDEVEYALGSPPEVLALRAPDPNGPPGTFKWLHGKVWSYGTDELPKGTDLYDHPEWSYPDWGLLTFNERRRLYEVRCHGGRWNTKRRQCISVFGLNVGSTESEIFNTLGEPDRQEINSGLKSFYFVKLGLVLDLEKGRVVYIDKRSPSMSPTLIWFVTHPRAWLF